MLSTAELHDRVCDPENLARAYARYASAKGLWDAGVPMSRIAAAPVGAVLRLAHEMRGGSYCPRPPHRLAIRKSDGGCRDIHVYMLRDRVAQRALLQVLQPLTEPGMSADSFGFRPGRSVAQAMAAVRRKLDDGLSWVVDADVEQCFDRMAHRQAAASVRSALDSDDAARLVSRWLGWPEQPARESRGLPQGSVLSPWLCNLYLGPLDAQLRRAGHAMVRYADDFMLFAPTRQIAQAALELCGETLAELQLALHPTNTDLK